MEAKIIKTANGFIPFTLLLSFKTRDEVDDFIRLLSPGEGEKLMPEMESMFKMVYNSILKELTNQASVG